MTREGRNDSSSKPEKHGGRSKKENGKARSTCSIGRQQTSTRSFKNFV